MELFKPQDKDYRPLLTYITWLDYSTGLLAEHRWKFNSILTIVCRTTKAARFIPTRSYTTVVDFAQIFFENIECEYGTPTSFISDRESRITSQFWAEVAIIKRHLSTADGWSKRSPESNHWRLPTSARSIYSDTRCAYNNSTWSMPQLRQPQITPSFQHGLQYSISCCGDDISRNRTVLPEAKTRVEKLPSY